ncbi:class I SAM-dependent methyltransferase [bacterium]|nr:MAG: class I SAM-dependent methyltransferase [bacterium]
MNSSQPAPQAENEQLENAPEFDALADEYAGGMEHPLKKFAGDSLEDFQSFKADWVVRVLGRNGTAPSDAHILDYGCGTGVLLRCLRDRGYTGVMEGGEVSPLMLEEAVRLWDEAKWGEVPALRVLAENGDDISDDTYDLVYASCVLHHVPEELHIEILRNIRRATKPGGSLIIFEHNPLHPITSWVVKTTAMDEGAKLITAGTLAARFKAAGWKQVQVRYLLFVPPRFPQADRVNWSLQALPFGGQYLITARP